MKSTWKCLDINHYYQLLGYYILSEIGSIDNVPKKTKIKIRKIGIYFSRYAYLLLLDLNEIIDRKSFPKFIEWFKERAEKEKENQFYSENIEPLPISLKNLLKKDEMLEKDTFGIKKYSFSFIKNTIILDFQYFSKSKLLDFKKNLKALGYKVSGKEERIGSSRNYSAQYFINNTKLE